MARSVRLPGEQELVAMLDGQLTAPVIAGALFGALIWGAAHA